MRKIQLKDLPGYPQGLVAVVDDEDYERLSAYRWSPRWGRRGAIYAQRMIYVPGLKSTCRQMQRDVLDPGMTATRWELSDHKNHDTLDNRRDNLRWRDPRGSALNRRHNLNNNSGYRGVSWQQSQERWRSCIMSYGVRYISYHRTADDAARAYNGLARIHHGGDAVLNDVPDAGPPTEETIYLPRNNTSGYRGVSVYNGGDRFRVSTSINGQRISLWGFTSAIEAARAYNRLVCDSGRGAGFLNIIPGDDNGD